MAVARKALWPLILGISAAAFAIASYKIFILGYALSDVLPRTQYDITLRFKLDGHGESVRIRSFLPASDVRQTILHELDDSPGLVFATASEGTHRSATWTGSSVPNDTSAQYRFSILSRPMEFRLDPNLEVPARYPASLAPYLRPEKEIQVDDPEIEKKLAELGANTGTVLRRLEKIYAFTSGLPQKPFKGTTDALTALRLGEASCNGKSRLFVAMARKAGIPARLVGGLLMERGSKRTTHQWVEVNVEGHWIPFCPTNKHFARIPENYLVFYVGDEALFKKTADINFDYRYDISTSWVPSERAKTSFRILNVWALFERLGLPFELLRTVLLLPLGALVVVLFRNVIGMPTFGTFLPALLAAASANTGAAWGVVGVIIVVAAVASVRAAVQRLRILHSPGLAILLTTVTMTMLATSAVSERLELHALSRISIFPIAVLAE